MNVFTKDKKGYVTLNVDDYDSVLDMMNDVKYVQEKNNDLLLDSIEEKLNGQKIDEEKSNFKVIDEDTGYVTLEFSLKL